MVYIGLCECIRATEKRRLTATPIHMCVCRLQDYVSYDIKQCTRSPFVNEN